MGMKIEHEKMILARSLIAEKQQEMEKEKELEDMVLELERVALQEREKNKQLAFNNQEAIQSLQATNDHLHTQNVHDANAIHAANLALDATNATNATNADEMKQYQISLQLQAIESERKNEIKQNHINNMATQARAELERTKAEQFMEDERQKAVAAQADMQLQLQQVQEQEQEKLNTLELSKNNEIMKVRKNAMAEQKNLIDRITNVNVDTLNRNVEELKKVRQDDMNDRQQNNASSVSTQITRRVSMPTVSMSN